jgi:phosphomannomutase/phosphoglucomutase
VSIFKACDIRGVAGSEVNADIARPIGRSLGEMIRRRNAEPVCVGGDFRRTTPAIKQALIEGLVESGVSVQDVGQVPTPVVYFAAKHLNCPSVAVVTASHNPGKYNGIKFMIGDEPAMPELMRELESGVNSVATSASRGTLRSVNVIDPYESSVRAKAATLGGASIAGMTIVLDAMEGAFTNIAPRVLEAEGARVISIGGAIDPDFARRTPNPAVDENLGALSKRVITEGADLGIALDGDGDRAAFVDHTGHVARAEQIGALLATEYFNHPTVVYDQKCASVLTSAVRAAEGKSIMQPSGYGFIKSAMIQNHADLGVEVSGHYFFKALGGGDDGLFAALVVARLLAQSKKPLADWIQEIGWPTITPDLRIPFQGDAALIVERIASTCGGRIARMDGVRAEYDDGWGLARASITEPLMTFRFEGKDASSLRRIVEQFLAAVPDLRSKVMEKIDA